MPFFAHISQGYFFDFVADLPDNEFHHQFCGTHDIPGAICPNCEKPLLLFLMLDKHDTRLNLQDFPRDSLPLLWCWTCNIAQKPMYYKISREGYFQWLMFGKAGVERHFPYANYPLNFPRAYIRLIPLMEEQQTTIKSVNRGEIDYYDLSPELQNLCTPAHQIGGEPYLVQQNPDYQHQVLREWVTCPICHRIMPFLAAIGDKTVNRKGFTGNEYVQVLFHYCACDHVVSAFNQCD